MEWRTSIFKLFAFWCAFWWASFDDVTSSFTIFTGSFGWPSTFFSIRHLTLHPIEHTHKPIFYCCCWCCYCWCWCCYWCWCFCRCFCWCWWLYRFFFTHFYIKYAYFMYTNEHLNWNGHQRWPCFSIDLSVTLPLRHLVERQKAFHLRCSRV